MLSREQIETAFARLNDELARVDQRAELFLVGGAVMCLVYNARPSTNDIDGWFSNATVVRNAADRIGSELGLDANWLNDAAKGFLPDVVGKEAWRDYGHLSVSVADAPTLLAMKCLAARSNEDVGDIRFLAGVLGLCTAAEVLTAILRYYPEERFPVRSRLLLEEMFG